MKEPVLIEPKHLFHCHPAEVSAILGLIHFQITSICKLLTIQNGESNNTNYGR